MNPNAPHWIWYVSEIRNEMLLEWVIEEVWKLQVAPRAWLGKF